MSTLQIITLSPLKVNKIVLVFNEADSSFSLNSQTFCKFSVTTATAHLFDSLTSRRP